MMKFPLPKLLKWFLNRFFALVFVFFLIGIVCFYIFFKTHSLSNFIFIFLLGFLFCSFVFTILFVRFLHSLARVFIRVQDIYRGKALLNTDESSYLDEEPGEFYELNRNLNQIHNYLRRQKSIISQESSELEAVISVLTGAILAIDQNKKVLFF